MENFVKLPKEFTRGSELWGFPLNCTAVSFCGQPCSHPLLFPLNLEPVF